MNVCFVAAGSGVNRFASSSATKTERRRISWIGFGTYRRTTALSFEFKPDFPFVADFPSEMLSSRAGTPFVPAWRSPPALQLPRVGGDCRAVQTVHRSQ